MLPGEYKIDEVRFPFVCNYKRIIHVDQNYVTGTDAYIRHLLICQWLTDNVSSYAWSSVCVLVFANNNAIRLPFYLAFAEENDVVAFKLKWGG